MTRGPARSTRTPPPSPLRSGGPERQQPRLGRDPAGGGRVACGAVREIQILDRIGAATRSWGAFCTRSSKAGARDWLKFGWAAGALATASGRTTPPPPTRSKSGASIRATPRQAIRRHETEKADIGIFGLAVMGENLALTFWTTASRSRYTTGRRSGCDPSSKCAPRAGTSSGRTRRGIRRSLEAPRKIMLMIRAGSPVDDVIEQFLPLLAPGDILIDGGKLQLSRQSAGRSWWRAAACSTWAAASPAARRARAAGPASCPAAPPPRGRTSSAVSGHRREGGRRALLRLGGGGRRGPLRQDGAQRIEYGDMQLIAEAYD